MDVNQGCPLLARPSCIRDADIGERRRPTPRYKAHIVAYCRWDGADEDTRPKLHKAAALFLTVDFVSSRPGVVVDLEPDFAIALQIARERAYPPS